MSFVDTSIFLRLLTNDVPEKADKCEKLFKSTVEGKTEIYTSELVLTEIVWVLESYYNLSKKKVRDGMIKILGTNGLNILSGGDLIESVEIYYRYNLDFIDAYNAVLMKKNNIKIIYSYDLDFDKIKWVKRKEP